MTLYGVTDATIDLANAPAGRTVRITGLKECPDLILEVNTNTCHCLGVKFYRHDEVVRLAKIELALPKESNR